MAIHKFGYESLQKDKIEKLEKKLESLTKVIHLRFKFLSDELDKLDNKKKFILTKMKHKS